MVWNVSCVEGVSLFSEISTITRFIRWFLCEDGALPAVHHRKCVQRHALTHKPLPTPWDRPTQTARRSYSNQIHMPPGKVGSRWAEGKYPRGAGDKKQRCASCSALPRGSDTKTKHTHTNTPCSPGREAADADNREMKRGNVTKDNKTLKISEGMTFEN